jgi:hypothetical protein
LPGSVDAAAGRENQQGPEDPRSAWLTLLKAT